MVFARTHELKDAIGPEQTVRSAACRVSNHPVCGILLNLRPNPKSPLARE
jgi:hypothetical protein